ncbi:MAG: hypothetical protein GY806_02815 [Gammaproteobacteria bacterium]|nr:hypothetical protein [Gammaproteobacteria bacterium]
MKKILTLGIAIVIYSLPVISDDVILDDQIVTNSLCVGAACIDGEEFDFDTVKLKADDPTIKFQDTSSTSSFPTNDWSMGITDNSAPEPAQFFINDVSGGTTVLLMEAGATGGIALGSGSAVVSDAISVGSAGSERRIVHVADGVADSDAATMGQFNTFSAVVNSTIAADTAAFDTELTSLQGNIDALSLRLDALIDRLDGN